MTAMYGFMQYTKLVTFDDTDVMLSSRTAYFDGTYVLTENLMFTFGITAYDDNPEPIEDASIG